MEKLGSGVPYHQTPTNTTPTSTIPFILSASALEAPLFSLLASYPGLSRVLLLLPLLLSVRALLPRATWVRFNFNMAPASAALSSPAGRTSYTAPASTAFSSPAGRTSLTESAIISRLIRQEFSTSFDIVDAICAHRCMALEPNQASQNRPIACRKAVIA